MNILEVYQKYQNMPLQVQHQLRVAAVAGLICDNFKKDISKSDIVKACLLHDLGNLVKFDFKYTKEFMPELVDQETLSHWETIKQQYVGKYGTSSHEATMAMARELGIDAEVLELIDCIGFNQGEDNAATDDFNKKICAYSDMRAEPRGVVPLEQRFVGLRHRYQNHKEGESDRQRFENALRKIEQQIFAHCDIKPQDITEQAIRSVMNGLKNFEI